MSKINIKIKNLFLFNEIYNCRAHNLLVSKSHNQ